MPYIETLKVLQTGNTSTSIFETMALLLNLNKDLHRVSFVRDREGSRLSVGDSLDLASPTSGKPRKKRWWEQKKETGQLRLPFSLYEPAEIIHVSYDNRGRRMRLELRFVNGEGDEKTITFYHNGHTPLGYDSIKAIRVHGVVKKWVEPTGEDAPDTSPFSDLASLTQTLSSGQRYSPSHRECADLVERAMEHGIAVTANHEVYDDITGERVGTEFRVVERQVSHALPDPVRYISFRRLDGTAGCYRINHSRIRFVDSRASSRTECHNMLEVAMRNGVVVTPSGKVYDRESGIFLGASLQLTSEPEASLFTEGRLRFRYSEECSVRGDLTMPGGERWTFQTYAAKIVHIDREVYTPPNQGTRAQQQNVVFARNYSRSGGSYSDWVNSVGGSFNIRGTQSGRVSGDGE